MKSRYLSLILIMTLVVPFALFAQFEGEGEAGNEDACKELSKEIKKEGGEQVPVYDESNLAQNTITATAIESLWHKECVLDVEARARSRQAADEITASIVEYLQAGYERTTPEGDTVQMPYYVGNVGSYLSDVSKEESEVFMSNVRKNINERGGGGAAFLTQVADTIESEEKEENLPGYNLDQFTNNNPDAFLEGDFSQGGWDGWHALTQNDYNNPIGTYVEVRQKLQDAKRSKRAEEVHHIIVNDGYTAPQNEDGNRDQPPHIAKDLTQISLESAVNRINSYDEAGENPDAEADIIHDITEDGETIQELSVESEEGFPIEDGWSGGALDIPDLIDFEIFDDLFNLDELINSFFGFFDATFADLLAEFDGVLEDLIAEAGIGDITAILERFDLDEIVASTLTPTEIIDQFGLENLVDEYGAEEVLDQLGQGLVESTAGGRANFLNSLDRPNLDEYLDFQGINPNDVIRDNPEPEDRMQALLDVLGILEDQLSNITRNHFENILRI